MKIDLLNSEGGIVIVSIVDDEIILSFHGTKETQKISKDDLLHFLYGNKSIVSPSGKEFKYSDYTFDMKPSLEKMNEFLNKLDKSMEIERKWLLYKLPDLPETVLEKAQAKSLVQIYTEKGRFRSESWTDPDGEVKSKYTHTIKKTIAPGIMDENEKEIQEIDFIMAFAENDGFIRKQRIEWKDGDVKWFLDSLEIHGTLLLEAEIPSIDYSLEIPQYLQDSIFAEVTGDKRFYNRTLRIKV